MQVKIDGNYIPNNIVQIFVIHIDIKMNWTNHIKHLKADINRRLNIKKILSHTMG